ncbi:hypothetical protein GALMADRAFT_253032 [Galerina marginata CBS 339.88]|uniref:Uncharacterized protein n=1 Tax=Galerina marginata (strain CBS 339.88) TaxID=685588 RepID=A0A067SMQ8_GALM3|nr:hypothetical protein GALMADRAFT_253032 [Galerina marginata CBS 339.88]
MLMRAEILLWKINGSKSPAFVLFFLFPFDHDTHHGPKGIFWSCELETTDGLGDNQLAFV